MVNTRSSISANGDVSAGNVEGEKEAAAAAAAAAEAARLENVHHYESAEDMPLEIQKYWHQRYDIFSRWDEGVWLTDEAWYGVTPEPVANKIATHIALSANPGTTTLIDLFAGVGGNTIAFALSSRWDRIFAIERDATVLACAKHNARLYGVQNKIWFIEGDCFEVLRKRLRAVVRDGAVVFGSPPWGGPGYRDQEVFLTGGMRPYGLGELVGVREGLGKGGLVLFLPRTSDLNEIASEWVKRKKGGEGEGKLRVTHYCMHGASKALCVFLGDFDFSKLGE
ncbi:Trimethylguanosine synthase [Sphaceloma murrayae]|uniref:Trimethylguanosine synthase n=1 Tax=Sphaceloma murrayae TaxID=2082308 RepID=A0A2K1QLV2_9PEZI|nr:Trimethylguanosine synthase [Sphaceloma murrayae]